jgi:hypothetical protein
MQDLLAVLTREGVLINASVRYPRFHKKLAPADLGLSPEQVSERLVSLGHKKLLPKEALAELALVEGRTHAIIDQGTFPFLGGLGHFLPNGKLVDVQEQLNAQRSHFHRAKETFLAAYRDLRSEALAEWEIAIRHIAGSRDEASCLYAQIAESFPAREKLADRFAFEVHLFQIAVPESLGMELVSFAEQQEVRLPVARPPKPPPARSVPAWRVSSANASPSCVTRPPSSATRCSPRCAPARPTASTRRPSTVS